MDLEQHFATIWKHRWRVLLATVVVAGLVFVWRNSRPRVYSASALLSVTPARAGNTQLGSKDDVQFLAETYAQLATTRPLVTQALAAGKLTIPLETAIGQISADAGADAGFIRLTTRADSPAAAEALDKAVAETLTIAVAQQQKDNIANDLREVINEINTVQKQIQGTPAGAQRDVLQAQLDALNTARIDATIQPIDRVQIVSPARADGGPISPSPVRDTLLALVVALVLNSELVVAIEAMSDRFSASDVGEEVSQITGLPVLARIPRGSDEETVEEIRTLRTGLMLVSTSVRTVALVGAEQGSGKSFLARRLAGEVAALGIPVLLVDGDLRRPVLHENLDVRRSPGLTDVLQGEPLNHALIPIPGAGPLQLLPAGRNVPDPAGLLGGNALSTVFKGASHAELILMDTPATNFFADAIAIASQCDVTVLVVNAQQSRRRAVRKLLAELRQVGVTPIGVVVNWASGGSRSSQYYYGARHAG